MVKAVSVLCLGECLEGQLDAGQHFEVNRSEVVISLPHLVR